MGVLIITANLPWYVNLYWLHVLRSSKSAFCWSMNGFLKLPLYSINKLRLFWLLFFGISFYFLILPYSKTGFYQFDKTQLWVQICKRMNRLKFNWRNKPQRIRQLLNAHKFFLLSPLFIQLFIINHNWCCLLFYSWGSTSALMQNCPLKYFWKINAVKLSV